MNPEDDCMQHDVLAAAHHQMMPEMAQIPFKPTSANAPFTSISSVNPVQASVYGQEFGQNFVSEPDSEPGELLKERDLGDGIIDATNLNADTLKTFLHTKRPLRFDWENKWLSGDQYAHMLNNIDTYGEYFGMPKFAEKQHPENIYLDPRNGQVYFVRANTIGSDFGFPRLGIKKRYKWKKMNFTTDLPKRNPLVSYIVASAVKCEKFFPGQGKSNGPVYRMHAVILKCGRPGRKSGMPSAQETADANQQAAKNPQDDSGQTRLPPPPKELHICCHVRRVEGPDEGDNDDSGGGGAANESKIKNIPQKPLIGQQMQSSAFHPDHFGKVPGPLEYQMGSGPQQQTSMIGLRPQFALGSTKDLKGRDNQANLTGTKRPRRVTAKNQQYKIDDGQDPYIYATTKIASRRARGVALLASQQQQQPQVPKRRGPKPGSTRGPKRPSRNLQPHMDFGARLFSQLKADISSNGSHVRRRRAYTEMDDLLGNDIKQGEHAVSEGHRGNSRSERNTSGSQTKRHQLSELGGDDSKGRVSIRLGGIIDALGANDYNQDQEPKKRVNKMRDKQQTSMQQNLFRSLGPEGTPQQSPLNAPLVPKIQLMDRRKFSLDLDYKKRVRDQDLNKMMKGKLQNWLHNRDQTTRQDALGIRQQPVRQNSPKKRQKVVKNTSQFSHLGRSPMMMPRIETTMIDQDQEEVNENGLRRRSSQIISADASNSKEVVEPLGGRPREDSISCFKKYGKTIIFNESNNLRQQASPLLSPSNRSSNTPQLAVSHNVASQFGQSPNLRAILMHTMGAGSGFRLPGQSQQMVQTPSFALSNALGQANGVSNNNSILNQLTHNQLMQSPLMQPALPKFLGLAANQNYLNNHGMLPFRSATRGSFMEQVGGGGLMAPPRNMSFNEFGANHEALFNSAMPRPPATNFHGGPGISELLGVQMPSHKMSLDLTRGLPDQQPK